MDSSSDSRYPNYLQRPPLIQHEYLLQEHHKLLQPPATWMARHRDLLGQRELPNGKEVLASLFGWSALLMVGVQVFGFHPLSLTFVVAAPIVDALVMATLATVICWSEGTSRTQILVVSREIAGIALRMPLATFQDARVWYLWRRAGRPDWRRYYPDWNFDRTAWWYWSECRQHRRVLLQTLEALEQHTPDANERAVLKQTFKRYCKLSRELVEAIENKGEADHVRLEMRDLWPKVQEFLDEAEKRLEHETGVSP